MFENIPIASGGKTSVAHGVGAANTATKTTTPAQGAAFQALIEKLSAEAHELELQSQKVESPADLATAVDRAHASLQDALSLSDGLLEAYRSTLLAREDAQANDARPGSDAQANRMTPTRDVRAHSMTPNGDAQTTNVTPSRDSRASGSTPQSGTR